jgi:hypothetical protein
MAIDCVPFLLDDENPDLIFLAPNEQYFGTVLTVNDADFYRYEMYENETMTFVVRIFPQDFRPIDAELTLYRLDGGTLVELGTSFMQQQYNTFTYDGTPGEYRFCIKSSTPIDYELSVSFTDYPFTLFPEVDNYHGSYVPSFDFAKPAYQCDSAVYYELIQGDLPDGLYISSSGFVFGIPDELDCQTLESDFPSFTYYEESPDDGEQARVSSSYDFPVTIRAALVDDPATFADRDFIICVRNNWDFDRDAFIENLPNLEVKRFVDVEVRGDDFVSEVEVAEDPLCDPCEEEDNIPAPLTEIQKAELCAVLQINEEFAGLIEINNNACVPCEEEDVVNPTELFQIEQTDACVVCEEPVEVVGLTALPTSMCEPCPIEQEKVAIQQVNQLFEDVPDDCLMDLVERMNTQKVCGGPIYCPERSPIYPAPPAQVKISLSDVCEKECE